MSHYVIEADDRTDPNRFPFRLLKDGEIVFEGRSSECFDEALRRAADGVDRLTSVLNPVWSDLPVEEIRSMHVRLATACGFDVDKYGCVLNSPGWI